jgi:putative Holliday junction resolvase
VLGIDLGASRTGIALSDPLAITCSPMPVIHERDEDKVLAAIVDLADEYGADEIVVGLPQSVTVLAFKERLGAATSRKVVTWDERFTSKLASRGTKRTGEHDSVAACYMLQGYLDWRSRA